MTEALPSPGTGQPSDVQTINFRWLIRLRWVAIVGQITIILGVDWLLGIRLPRLPLALIVGIEAASNALCALSARRPVRVTDALLTAILAGDVILLSALLYLTGGPLNPFSFLYVVHIALAAVSLRPLHTWTLTLLSILGFGLLFLLPAWDGGADAAHSQHDHMRLHLEGMYVAFGLAAVLIVYFVQRVTQALAQRDIELTAARSLAARHEKFASLATLAAGAAHELATPLSTIAVVARELERALEKQHERLETVADVRLIREQVKRCHEILQQLAADAGQGSGENLRLCGVDELLALAIDALPGRERLTMVVEPPAHRVLLEVPPRAVARSLRALMKNALQATASWQQVALRATSEGTMLRFEVRDEGAGMLPAVLAHAGEPFFTTKAPGEGMGLGLFLARTLVGRLNGKLDIDSEPGRGTRAVMTLPIALQDSAGLSVPRAGSAA
ncbi:MAG: HAMP domain-containing histidine kinase [Deltaproteobacteria bacterium]|nr:HAMP domain-containing histidine kinase [Deltaproteobacteria bacterium]